MGVEVGGAVENVIAIACGMMTGAGFAENTRAALIARELEMRRLAEALGGRDETVNGLSGMGDLVLTCSSPTSRDFALGAQLGAGRPRAACFDGRDVVVEGEVNALSVIEAARRAGVSMPICEAIQDHLHRGHPPGRGLRPALGAADRAEATGLSLAIEHPGGPAALQDLTRRLTLTRPAGPGPQFGDPDGVSPRRLAAISSVTEDSASAAAPWAQSMSPQAWTSMAAAPAGRSEDEVLIWPAPSSA